MLGDKKGEKSVTILNIYTIIEITNESCGKRASEVNA